MNLNKIEAALEALGWNGEVRDISINSENGICNVNFSVTKGVLKKEEESSNVTSNERVRTEEEKPISKVQFPIKIDPPSDKKDKSDYIPARNRKIWKTPVPRTVLRYVYFKDRKSADAFINSYRDEFEFREDEISRDEAVRCTLRPTHKEESPYYEGYSWCLSFRMNGAAFEVLENCEGLKKKKHGKRGGACVRLKD